MSYRTTFVQHDQDLASHALPAGSARGSAPARWMATRPSSRLACRGRQRNGAVTTGQPTGHPCCLARGSSWRAQSLPKPRARARFFTCGQRCARMEAYSVDPSNQTRWETPPLRPPPLGGSQCRSQRVRLLGLGENKCTYTLWMRYAIQGQSPGETVAAVCTSGVRIVKKFMTFNVGGIGFGSKLNKSRKVSQVISHSSGVSALTGPCN